MRAPSKLLRGVVQFNMTPMIDVVFLLIIFFLVSSHLAQQEIQTELDLPAAASGRLPKLEARRIVVNVLRDGTLLFAGEPVDEFELADRIRVERQTQSQSLEIRVRCDRHVPYVNVEPILTACASAGVWNLTFAVIERPPAT